MGMGVDMDLRNMDETLGFTGRSTLRAFQRGVIGELLKRGMALDEAVKQAIRDGYCVHENTVNNLVVTIGKQLVGDLMIGAVATGLTYYAIGTGTTTPALTDTKLASEVARKSITLKTRTGLTLSLSTFFTAANCSFNLQEGGVFGGAASDAIDSGTLFSHFLQAYDNSAGEHDLSFEYNVEVK